MTTPPELFKTSASGSIPRSRLAKMREEECRGLLEVLHEMGLVPPVRHYSAGDDIFFEEEPGDGLYVLTEGMAKLSKRYSEAKEITLRLIGAWEVFGDLAPGIALAQGADAQAFTDSKVIKIPKVFIERAVRTRLKVSGKLLTLLGLELAYHKELAACLLPRTTEARLAVLLPDLAQRFGEVAGSAIALPRLTHFDLAAMIGTTRESVTAAMKSLRQRGVLKKEGQQISILDFDRLTRIAEARYGGL